MIYSIPCKGLFGLKCQFEAQQANGPDASEDGADVIEIKKPKYD